MSTPHTKKETKTDQEFDTITQKQKGWGAAGNRQQKEPGGNRSREGWQEQGRRLPLCSSIDSIKVTGGGGIDPFVCTLWLINETRDKKDEDDEGKKDWTMTKGGLAPEVMGHRKDEGGRHMVVRPQTAASNPYPPTTPHDHQCKDVQTHM